MEIKTNHQWRGFLYRDEIPESVIESDFDYLSPDETDGFIKYKSRFYHLSEFMRFHNENAPFPGDWHGYICDSAFSGVLVRVSQDGEQYQIATYLS